MKKLILWIRIGAIALIVLGIIHTIATVMVFPMFQNLAKEQLSVFLFMYMATGMGTILSGLVSVFAVGRIREKDITAWLILLFCASFALIIGIGGIISLKHNPFAYLGLIIGFTLFIPTILIRKHYRKEHKL